MVAKRNDNTANIFTKCQSDTFSEDTHEGDNNTTTNTIEVEYRQDILPRSTTSAQGTTQPFGDVECGGTTFATIPSINSSPPFPNLPLPFPQITMHPFIANMASFQLGATMRKAALGSMVHSQKRSKESQDERRSIMNNEDNAAEKTTTNVPTPA